jgi:Ankyrin repeats (many copies)
MVEAVSHCTSLRSVMDKLDKLPPKLDVLYNEALERIVMQAEEHAALAKRVLLWVAYAHRPLSVRELMHAVANDSGIEEPEFRYPNAIDPWAYTPPKNHIPESLMISVCCGLVVSEDRWQSNSSPWSLDFPNPFRAPASDRIFRFVRQSSFYFSQRPLAHLLIDYTAHGSVKRALERCDPSPHCLIAEFCIKQVMSTPYEPCSISDYWSKPSSPRRYAYESWSIHAKEAIQLPAQRNVRPVPLLLHFFQHSKGYFVLPGLSPIQDDMLTAPVHFVAYFHLTFLLPLIDPNTVNQRTKRGDSALILAVWNNDPAMVKLLLQLGEIDVGLRNRDGNTALDIAEHLGYEEIVAILRLDPRCFAIPGLKKNLPPRWTFEISRGESEEWFPTFDKKIFDVNKNSAC